MLIMCINCVHFTARYATSRMKVADKNHDEKRLIFFVKCSCVTFRESFQLYSIAGTLHFITARVGIMLSQYSGHHNYNPSLHNSDFTNRTRCKEEGFINRTPSLGYKLIFLQFSTK